MREFVHDHMRDQIVEFDIGAVTPLGQNRFAEQPHGVGRGRKIVDEFFGHRNSVIKTGQLQRVGDAEIGEHVGVGPVGDAQQHQLRGGAKGVGHRVDGAAGNGFEMAEVRGHDSDMIKAAHNEKREKRRATARPPYGKVLLGITVR